MCVYALCVCAHALSGRVRRCIMCACARMHYVCVRMHYVRVRACIMCVCIMCVCACIIWNCAHALSASMHYVCTCIMCACERMHHVHILECVHMHDVRMCANASCR